MLDGFAEHDFRKTVRVNIGGVESVDAQVISCFDVLDTYGKYYQNSRKGRLQLSSYLLPH